MGGRLASESVAGFRRNQWPAWLGLRTLDKAADAYAQGYHGVAYAILLGAIVPPEASEA